VSARPLWDRMDFRSSTKNRKLPPAGIGAFTLLEVMMVTMISAFVFAGVMSAYIFLGRGLARQVNEQGLESRTRLALYWMTQDVSSASSISPGQVPSSTGPGPWPYTVFTLVVPGYSGNVSYLLDWSKGAAQGVLERQVGSGTYLTLLTNLSSISFTYYDVTGNSVSVPASVPAIYSPQINVKQVSMAYTTTAGTASTGAQSNLTMVSPRVIMKNKMLLVDPTNP